MRVLVIEILFIASTLPVWRAEFDVTDYIDLNSYVLYAAAFWILVFTSDILRTWWKSKPRKHRIQGFEAIEPGVPHGRFIQTGEQSFTVFLRTSVPAFQILQGIMGLSAAVLAVLFLLHNDGWIGGSTVTRISLEIVTGLYALGYSLSAISPSKIEIHLPMWLLTASA